MPYPIDKWDEVPVWIFYTPGTVGTVEATVDMRITRDDGREVWPTGHKEVRVIGEHGADDLVIRNAVRAAWHDADQAAQGGAFDEAAWSIWWDSMMPSAVFFGFPAVDDTAIRQSDFAVTIDEKLNNGGGKTYTITPLLAHLNLTPPGINLGDIEVPVESPSNPPGMYALGIAGGIATLSAEGFVVDAHGNVLDPAEFGGADGATVEQTVAALGTDKLATSAKIVKTYEAGVINLDLADTVESTIGAQTKATTAKTEAVAAAATDATTKADAAKARSTHTGTQSADTLTDGTTNKVFVAAEKTKLSGIATGATANAADSALRDRSTHTGTQPATTVAVSATSRILGRSTAGAGAAEELTATQAKSLLALQNVDNTADTAKPISTLQQTALDAKARRDRPVTTQTGTTYTVAATDVDTVVTLSNAGTKTVTLPSNTAVAIPVGASITFTNTGAGAATFVAGASAGLSAVTPTLPVDGVATAIKRSTNVWVLDVGAAGTVDVEAVVEGLPGLGSDDQNILSVTAGETAYILGTSNIETRDRRYLEITGATHTVGVNDRGRVLRVTGTGDCTITVPNDAALPYGPGGCAEFHIVNERSTPVRVASTGVVLDGKGATNFLGSTNFAVPTGGWFTATRLSSSSWRVRGDWVDLPNPPTLIQRYARTGSATTHSLPAPATAGRTLIAAIRFSVAMTPTAPTGFTQLAIVTASNGQDLGLYAKTAVGGEQSITTEATTSAELMEWSGLAPVGSLYDGTNSVTADIGTPTSWNPAAVTAGQASALYLGVVATSADHGGVTSDWAGTPDATHNTHMLMVCRKVTSSQAAFDTSVSWTNGAHAYGGVFVLRGA